MTRSRRTATGLLAILMSLAVVGCGSGTSSPTAPGSAVAPASGSAAPVESAPAATSGAGAVTQADIDAAMDTPTELTFWTWVPDIEDEVALFEKAYPKISVKVENVGQGAPHYQKIRTALTAGEGAPDVAQIEYQFIPSFEITNSLLDLTPYVSTDLKGQFPDWIWNQVTRGEVINAIPQDAGPMGYLYRDDLFDKAGVTEPPTSYEQFKADAATVHSATGSYITTFAPNNAGQILGLLWQAGVRPFAYDGDKAVQIHVNSDEAKQVMAYWQDLVQQDLINVDPNFTDEWYRQFADGTSSGWLTAAWAPVFLQGTAADTAGKWRAATLPQWTADANVSGNWGGSSTAVMTTTENPIAAAQFAQWLNTDQESALLFATQQFLYPTLNSVLTDPLFADAKSDFYGGQQVNKLFAEISDTVDVEFQWLPFMDVAFSTYDETIGKAIGDKGDFAAGLDAWQDALVSYATEQGFTVNQ